MFAYEPPLSPPCDEWKEYTLPLLCNFRLEQVCEDILTNRENTRYQEIYAAMRELVEAKIEEEYLEDYVY